MKRVSSNVHSCIATDVTGLIKLLLLLGATSAQVKSKNRGGST